MATLVVVDVSRASGALDSSARLDIFPGGAIPSVFPADTPFWIGYGFAIDAEAEGGAASVDESTHFELDVDGRPFDLESDALRHDDVVVRKTDLAEFGVGLVAGWHSFHGRWYDGGKLLLSSRVSIEFVEP
jgi:hypothetical protein